MIAFLRGEVIERGADHIVMDVGGVGYQVTVTAAALRSLPASAEARVFIYTHASQDAPYQLFGFADAQERRTFELLLTVQGVGPKVAVAVLSTLSGPDLVRAISAGEVARLTQVRGVGKRLAERLCVELRDKIGVALGARPDLGSGSGAALGLPGSVPPGRLGEVHGALVSLGYKPHEFEGVLSSLDPEKPAPDLVKSALALLRKR